AINYIIVDITGFDNWFLWYVLFAGVQIYNAALGINAVDKFAVFAAPAIILISIWMFVRLTGLATDQGVNIFSYVGTQENTTWFLIMIVNMGFWAPLVLDIPNITRYVKAPKNEKKWLRRNSKSF